MQCAIPQLSNHVRIEDFPPLNFYLNTSVSIFAPMPTNFEMFRCLRRIELLDLNRRSERATATYQSYESYLCEQPTAAGGCLLLRTFITRQQPGCPALKPWKII